MSPDGDPVAGATVELVYPCDPHGRPGPYNAHASAVQIRRPDLAALLFAHGVRATDVSTRDVVDVWDRTWWSSSSRTARASCAISHAQGVALLLWAGAALLLWAGADPWASGPDRLEDLVREEEIEDDTDDEDDPGGLNAMELAILHDELAILKQTNLIGAPDPVRPETLRVLETPCLASADVLAFFFERGYRPTLQTRARAPSCT